MSRLFGVICRKPANLSCKQLDTLPEEHESPGLSPATREAFDGWGIGFYRNKGSFLYKKTARSSGVQRITNISEIISSHIFISHLRMASVGERKEANTHPFRWGNWLWAHTGTFYSFRKIRSRILRGLPPAYKKSIQGNTDSEHLFYYYLSLLRGEGGIKKGKIPLNAAVEGMKKFFENINEFQADAEIAEQPVLNFLVTNGQYLLATRYGESLWYHVSDNSDAHPCTYISPLTLLQYELIHDSEDGAVIVISTEQLSLSGDWKEIPEGSILSVDASLNTAITPFK